MKKKKPPTCALYHRVSTRDQHPRAAMVELRSHAKRLGLRVAFNFAETVGATNWKRPELEQVMEHARKGKIDAIIVWKLDRFGRSTIDLLARIQELEQLGVRFVCSTQGIDVDPKARNPLMKFFITNISAVAELEREMIVERTHLGLDHARRRGRRLGRPMVRLDLEKVRDMREREGKTWTAIAGELGVDRATIRNALERDAKLLAKSVGGPVGDAIRRFVERGAAAQRAVDDILDAGADAHSMGCPPGDYVLEAPAPGKNGVEKNTP